LAPEKTVSEWDVVMAVIKGVFLGGVVKVRNHAVVIE